MLFFMLSGYLLADTFWRTEPADLRIYAIRRFFRIAPAYYVNLAILFLFFAAHRLVFSEQGVKQSGHQRDVHAVPLPRLLQLAQRQRRLVDADHRDAALRVPADHGAAGPLQPLDRHGAADRDRAGLARTGRLPRRRVAGLLLRRRGPYRLRDPEPVHRPAVHRRGGHLRARHPGPLAGGPRPPRPDLPGAARPPRRQLVPGADAAEHGPALLGGEGHRLHQPAAVHRLRLHADGGAPAGPAAGGPTTAVQPQPPALGHHVAGRAQLQHLPVALPAHPGDLRDRPGQEDGRRGRLLVAAAGDPGPHPGLRPRQLPHGRATRHGVGQASGQARLRRSRHSAGTRPTNKGTTT